MGIDNEAGLDSETLKAETNERLGRIKSKPDPFEAGSIEEVQQLEDITFELMRIEEPEARMDLIYGKLLECKSDFVTLFLCMELASMSAAREDYALSSEILNEVNEICKRFPEPSENILRSRVRNLQMTANFKQFNRGNVIDSAMIFADQSAGHAHKALEKGSEDPIVQKPFIKRRLEAAMRIRTDAYLKLAKMDKVLESDRKEREVDVLKESEYELRELDIAEAYLISSGKGGIAEEKIKSELEQAYLRAGSIIDSENLDIRLAAIALQSSVPEKFTKHHLELPAIIEAQDLRAAIDLCSLRLAVPFEKVVERYLSILGRYGFTRGEVEATLKTLS